MAELHLACACGAVRWLLAEDFPRTGIRYICHCDDCQAFAYFLERADSILDSHGGTDAYQLPASRLKIAAGLNDDLACVQVTRRPTLRWYCRHCRTPVATTYHKSTLSFLSIPLCGAPAAQRDEVLGSPSGHVWTKFGYGDLSKVKQLSIVPILWRMTSRMISARLTGDYRNNPLFDVHTGGPIASPRCITSAERSELDRKAQSTASGEPLSSAS